MNWFRWVGIWAAVLLVGAGCACAVDGDSKSDESVSATAPKHKIEMNSADTPQASNAKSIPLLSIVTTSPQSGMLHTKDVFSQKDPDQNSVVAIGYLRQILRDSKGGASNVFLVDAVNASSAIAASSGVFIGSRSADISVPVNKPDPPRDNHWLVVYLGSGPGSPVYWKIDGVKLNNSRVTLTYRKAPLSPVTTDVHLYYYWVPLGTLTPGTYEVKLFDADRRTTTLMRRVEVASPIEKGSTP